jgi:outer membrane protein TolC
VAPREPYGSHVLFETKAAQQTLALATSQYKDGVVSYLDVVTAQATELTAQISSLDLRTRQLTASVSLVQALGGGRSSEPA